jgi:hypothetical protein
MIWSIHPANRKAWLEAVRALNVAGGVLVTEKEKV